LSSFLLKIDEKSSLTHDLMTILDSGLLFWVTLYIALLRNSASYCQWTPPKSTNSSQTRGTASPLRDFNCDKIWEVCAV